jgi:hypothetical protein
MNYHSKGNKKQRINDQRKRRRRDAVPCKRGRGVSKLDLVHILISLIVRLSCNYYPPDVATTNIIDEQSNYYGDTTTNDHYYISDNTSIEPHDNEIDQSKQQYMLVLEEQNHTALLQDNLENK